MGQWLFNETKFIEESNFNPILERFYEYGINGLVRENIQNSLDARLTNELPVIVKIVNGQIDGNEIPGFEEIKNRILNLSSGNNYVKETIDEMKSQLNRPNYDYISFEDMNTKGLTGSKFGQVEDIKYSYSAYAYSKGVHFEDADLYNEKLRGGSHGVGKIASNAASIFYTMFFSNYDENDYQTLGGTIQLVDHKFNNKYYRSTGYFTNEINGKYIPYENKNYSNIFEKTTRGLKIVVPFLREQFVDETEIVRSVCDSFMLAILKGDLIVLINGLTINETTIEGIIFNEEYFKQDTEGVEEYFTPLYFRTYQHLWTENLIIEDRHRQHRFKLYFQYDEDIRFGRTGVYRSIGMKIEDKKIISYTNKPYNALLVPFSIDEDMFLKSLENESHTKLDFSHFKNAELQANAKRFINNLSRKISEIIDEEMNKRNPTEGIMDTKDIIYEVDNTFKRDLQKHLTEINIGKGKEKKTIVKTNDTDEEGESTTSKKRRRKNNNNYIVKVKKEFGNQGKKEYYQLSGTLVKRSNDGQREFMEVDLGKQDIFASINMGNLLVSLIDGMGIEYTNEYDLNNEYEYIIDLNSKCKLTFTKNSIKQVDLSTGKILLSMKMKGETSKRAKLKYYLEV